MPITGNAALQRSSINDHLGGDLHSSERQSLKMGAFVSPCCFLEVLSSGISQLPRDCHQLKNSFNDKDRKTP
jgi:hypothetical protein